MKLVQSVILMLGLVAAYSTFAEPYQVPWFADVLSGMALGWLSYEIVEALS